MHRLALACLAVALSVTARADPEQDREAFRAYFLQRFPDVPVDEYVNGIYAIDEKAREQWREIEAFPPYEFAVEQGEALLGNRLPTVVATRTASKTGASESVSIFRASTWSVARSSPSNSPSTSAAWTMASRHTLTKATT